MLNQEVASAVPVSRSKTMINQINKNFQLYQQLYHCITVSAVSAVSLYHAPGHPGPGNLEDSAVDSAVLQSASAVLQLHQKQNGAAWPLLPCQHIVLM